MMITDEMLSAYLDNELSGQDRERVQTGLRDDAALAERLAQLAHINTLVGKQSALIDALPLPASVMAMLNTAESGKVIEMSRFRRTQQHVIKLVREHAALAASLALLAGVAGTQLLPLSDNGNSADNANTAYFAALDTAPSGQRVMIDADSSLTARFSFIDTESRYCRQYLAQNTQTSSENIACRVGGDWTLAASIESTVTGTGGQYQTASGPMLLDDVLDSMMPGAALTLADEQAAIEKQWQMQ